MTKTFDGAVLVITDPTTADETAAKVASGWFPDSPYHYTVTESTPTSFPDKIQNRTRLLQEMAGAGSVVLTVYPWAATQNPL